MSCGYFESIKGVNFMAKLSKYKEDKHLTFLQFADYKDLKVLADILIKDIDGSEQWTGGLKQTIKEELPRYKDEQSLYQAIWQAIVAELQLYGGDTLVNTVRRSGVLYEKILMDVAKKIGADFVKGSSIEKLEERILLTLFKRIPDMCEMNELLVELKAQGYLGITSLKSHPLNTIKQGVNVKKVAGGALAFVPRVLAGASVGSLLAIHEITAPAYRVTIPAVCAIAIMRKKYESGDNSQHNEF